MSGGFRYLSVCSGIEAATVAWRPLGWKAAAFSEIEPFPRAVLSHHYPDTPLHGDFTTIGADDYGPIDLLVGGTPCQSFSVAGLRGGMDDERGQLSLQFLKLADRKRARWVVWENVPGVLSSNGGRDFGSFLGGLVELGYGFAYRVLDAQFFGVPQRRRRVFVVGYLGDWRRAAAVLFERHSLSGDSPPRRQAGEVAAPCLSASTGGVSGKDAADARLVQTFDRQSSGEYGTAPVASAVSRRDYKCASDLITHSLRGEGFDASEDGTGRGTPLVPVEIKHGMDCIGADGAVRGQLRDTDRCGDGLGEQVIAFTAKDHGADASDISPTLRSGSHSGSHANGGVMPAVAFNITPSNSNKDYNARQSERAQALTAGGNRPSARGGDLIAGSAVRRLTPRECERLQGFPDDYTAVPVTPPNWADKWPGRVKYASDGSRYKALGNSMAVPVMRWIGERIAAVESLQLQQEAA